MISYAPGKTGSALLDRIIDVATSSFALAQSASDVARAIGAIFRPTTPGTVTLTLGTTAPDSILTTTPTRWITIIEADGLPTVVPGWR